VPETFIIGRDGVIRKKLIGAVDWNSEANRAVIEQLLREPSRTE
jgi:peroxiredoxin